MEESTFRTHSRGSPPRVRGHVCIGDVSSNALGITPAGAGTCAVAGRLPKLCEDHPRGCGDMSLNSIPRIPHTGSPPRVRGHENQENNFRKWLGITPAGAGTCKRRCIGKSCAKDHPRGCGDMFREEIHQIPDLGSPPRVRGHGKKGHKTIFLCGITPAGAGTCFLFCGAAYVVEDHPRGCGDMSGGHRYHCCDRGSPPRVRGHACYRIYRCLCTGITPAGAGTCIPPSLPC